MSCCAATSCNADYLQETAAKLDRLESERIISASMQLGENRYKTEFVVPDMHCGGCIRKIEHELAKMSGIEQVRANLSFRSVSVIWNSNKSDGRSIYGQS